ncbi:MAG: hypothetical protein J1F32_02680 [Erysipelotrichales bacterium]|nr:hypothetical protein [Erysipelotrichales bacterium]
MKYNNLRKIIAATIAWISLILVFVANVVPAIVLKSGDEVLKGYLVSMFAAGSISSSSVTSIAFYGVLMVILLFVCPILMLIDNSIVKKLNFALSLGLFGTLVYYMTGLSELENLISSNVTFTLPGIIILIIAYGLILIGTLYIVIDDLYGEKIKQLMTPTNEKSLAELLEETEKLYEMNVITEEEYKARRANLISRG